MVNIVKGRSTLDSLLLERKETRRAPPDGGFDQFSNLKFKCLNSFPIFFWILKSLCIYVKHHQTENRKYWIQFQMFNNFFQFKF